MQSLDEVPSLASIQLHRLKGKRRVMTINRPWRLVFAFKKGHAYDVEIVDYH